ncbi:LysE family translocator [Nocardia asteroides]|uniref:LysE family translocator n=1 Tax=Nocardia asteroides TaxID=1824 RepID=UPI001E57FBA0|nr:LysE family translocator [Nocardia asteroides]UGT59486.1 LysE family translocator [Nocardia asteroides]
MGIEFLLTTVIIAATPGTGVLFTVAAGLARGARASVVAAFGCTLGVVPHVLAAVTGLAALLHTSALAFQTVKYLGVAYLLYLAWSTLRERGALTLPEPGEAPSARRGIGSAVLLNLLNPKLTLFFVAFLPQFVPIDAAAAHPAMLAAGGVFMAVTFVVFVGYGLGAAAMRANVLARPRVVGWMRRVFGASFLLLAGRLAVQDR